MVSAETNYMRNQNEAVVQNNMADARKTWGNVSFMWLKLHLGRGYLYHKRGWLRINMAQANEIEDMNVGEGEDHGLTDDAEMALTGINMLLNNGFDEAYALFEKYK